MTVDQPGIGERRRAMGVLADSPTASIEAAMAGLETASFRLLRSAETGLVMARGRMGGTGAPFNLGEVSVTRCAVTDGMVVGHGYVRGRDARKALLIARCDALLQQADQRPRVLEQVVRPLEAELAARRAQGARRAAATRVEFFTLVRGDA